MIATAEAEPEWKQGVAQATTAHHRASETWHLDTEVDPDNRVLITTDPSLCMLMMLVFNLGIGALKVLVGWLWHRQRHESELQLFNSLSS